MNGLILDYVLGNKRLKVVLAGFNNLSFSNIPLHDLSQDLETGCPKLAIVKFWGVQIFKGGGGTTYSDFNHKHVQIHQNKA